MRDAMDSTGKPVILVMPEFKQGQDSLDITDLIRETRQVFLEKGILVFNDLGNALRALGHVSQYARFVRSLAAN
jgi:hypothetical protein